MENSQQSFLTIDSFKADFFFLSNTYPCRVYWDHKLFPSASTALCEAQYNFSPEVIHQLQQPWDDDSPTDEVKKILKFPNLFAMVTLVYSY